MTRDATTSRATVLDPSLFRTAIGRFATGVTVITCELDGVRHGTTASAVSSLSAEPPMLLVCLNGTSDTGRAVGLAGAFAVNVLAHDQGALARRLATKEPGKFDGVAARAGVHGAPLLDGALAHLECRVAEVATGGTHTVFLAHVVAAAAHGGEPLTYWAGRFGGFTDLPATDGAVA